MGADRIRTSRVWTGIAAVLVALTLSMGGAIAAPSDQGMGNGTVKKSTADHSKFKELQGPFATGPDVTSACLKCHTEASKQIHKTTHWTWEFENPKTGQKLGKKNVVNNFCGSVRSNEPRCTSCHIGYGWKDDNFDFASEKNVDCLICHDGTGTYRKFPVSAGHPLYEPKRWPPKPTGKLIQPPDLIKVAQSVGPTSRRTCGMCHFTGGGGNAVKHGDLDVSMINPGPYLDVHMSPKKLNFTCSTCHNTDAHSVSGSRYNPKAVDTEGIDVPGRGDQSRSSCRSCHGDHPMKNEKLNEHTDKIACQTCHIPFFARGGFATKTAWDWSTAGKLDDHGKPISVKNEKGHEIYNSKKGDFLWEDFVVPDYQWFDGTVNYTLPTDTIDPTQVVQINTFGGTPGAADSRIWPTKVMKGKQAYDAGQNRLAVVHTFGKDDSAYWTNYDWDKALAAGMEAVGQEYSGKLGFVATEMRWPITHMVAPASDSLVCEDCHARNGRMDGIEGIYLPGRDRLDLLDTAGYALIILSALGVLGHGALRIVMHYRHREQ